MSPSAVAPSLSRTKRFVIAAASAINDAACRSDGTVNRRLVSLLDARVAASAKPFRGVRTADVPVDLSCDLWFRLFVPSSVSDGERLPTIVFFHGGGFAFLSPDSYLFDDVCRRICRTDGAHVLRFLDGGGLLYADPSAAELADLSSCFLVGDSAGGNIVHHVARRWAADADGGWKRVRLSGMVLIQPYFGGEERTEAELRLVGAPLVSVERTDWLWRAFLPEGADRDHEASNDWQRRYYKGLRARGKEARLVEYPEAFHSFYAFPDLKQSTVLMEEIKSFVDSHRPRKEEGRK
ncbi:hypothetical protein GW17_00009965 [Ensete ventricosum]|nr:hypothetical protein GW17_00009965 [Ensete ventricosum]